MSFFVLLSFLDSLIASIFCIFRSPATSTAQHITVQENPSKWTWKLEIATTKRSPGKNLMRNNSKAFFNCLRLMKTRVPPAETAKSNNEIRWAFGAGIVQRTHKKIAEQKWTSEWNRNRKGIFLRCFLFLFPPFRQSFSSIPTLGTTSERAHWGKRTTFNLPRN